MYSGVSLSLNRSLTTVNLKSAHRAKHVSHICPSFINLPSAVKAGPKLSMRQSNCFGFQSRICATNLLCFRLHALTTTAEQSLTWELLLVNKTKTIKSRTKSFTHTAVELRIWHGSKVHLL